MNAINIVRKFVKPESLNINGDQSGKPVVLSIINNLPKIKPFVFPIEAFDAADNVTDPSIFKGYYLPFNFVSLETIQPIPLSKESIGKHTGLDKLKTPHLVGVLVRENSDLSIDDIKIYADINNDWADSSFFVHDSYKNYEDFWARSIANIYLKFLFSRNIKIGTTGPLKTNKSGKDPEFVKRLVIISKTTSVKMSEFKSFGKIEWKHQWRVRGHWRKISSSMIGKDREGEYSIVGNTWVKDSIKGDGPLIEKTRILKGDNK